MNLKVVVTQVVDQRGHHLFDAETAVEIRVIDVITHDRKQVDNAVVKQRLLFRKAGNSFLQAHDAAFFKGRVPGEHCVRPVGRIEQSGS